jgi:hypothetical protein
MFVDEPVKPLVELFAPTKDTPQLVPFVTENVTVVAPEIVVELPAVNADTAPTLDAPRYTITATFCALVQVPLDVSPPAETL